MRSWRILRIALLASVASAAIPAGHGVAGTFEALEPFYRRSISSSSVLVVVEGTGVYRGVWDTNDDHAFIQTTAYVSNGDPAGNAGNGYNRNGPFWEGYPLPCTDNQNGCPGRIWVARPLCSFEPQPFYRGRNGVVIYHQNSPEISTNYGCSEGVPCSQSPEPEDPCEDPSLATSVILPIRGGPQIVRGLPEAPIPLNRVEEVDGIRYRAEEWTVLAVDTSLDQQITGVEVISASDTEYGDSRRRTLLRGAEPTDSTPAAERIATLGRGSTAAYFKPGRSILLSLHEPGHPRNPRWIPMPVPRLQEPPTSPLLTENGVVLVRADFAPDRSMSSLDVLYASRPLSRADRAYVEESLTLKYGTERLHRAVLFAVLRMRDGRLSIERSHVVLPQCCCTETDPETGECIGPEI